jgi:hypothetical protein
MATLKPKKPVLMFFQEIRPGDVEKQKATSNLAPTGGGARDLRIRPATEFTAMLTPMFPLPGPQQGVTQGPVYWLGEDNSIRTTQVEYWRPTAARPGEARIGRIHFIEAWSVDEQEYANAAAAGNKWFYLLVMDADSVVWARILKEENLPNENRVVREYIERRIGETQPHHAVRGSMNFRTREEYP